MNGPDHHVRRSLRLKNYDYSQAGAYFVTVCAHNRMCIFGKVDAAEMRLSEIGRTVDSCWKEIPMHFQVSLDQWIVMPNHLHGIIIMADEAPLATDDALLLRPALGAIVGAFKSAATKRVNEEPRMERSPLWQRNLYEHVIRNEADLGRIRQIIVDNPIRWAEDPENPNVIAGGKPPLP
jgi:putative transposase